MDSNSRSETRSDPSKSAFKGGQPTTDQNMHFNTPAVAIGGKVNDGDEFILITRSRQSDGFTVWSSGDEQVTEQLYKQAARQVAGLETTS